VNPLNVLSLFDGMACGYEALKRAGIPVACYGASEIDPYAMKIALKNHPDIKHIGSIENWREWGFSAGDFDLIIGGSPCQGFSGAGAGLNFSDPRSKLYFEFEAIIKTLKPRWWLLENVRMKKQWADIISERMGVQPVLINSALVSAQNRERLYWANFPISQPVDRGVLLKDIVLPNTWPVVVDCVRVWAEGTPRIFEGKTPTLRTPSGGARVPYLVCRQVGRRLNNGVRDDYNTGIKHEQYLEPRLDEKSGCLSTVEKDNLLLSVAALEYMDRPVKGGRTHWDFAHHSDTENDKASACVANFFKGVPYNVLKDKYGGCIRKFHPVECERLQTLSDGYSEGVSATQRYKMIGNGWTVEVIKEIFQGMIL
jgi:site-specific DNA-cytosine methylase